MISDDLRKYSEEAVEKGCTHVKPIHPASVVTAPWVRLKCQFGCPGYGWSHCCPPDTPSSAETRKVLDTYQYALLFHIALPKTPNRRNHVAQLLEVLVDLEGEAFKDGYYKAFVYLAGPCGLCKACAKTSGKPCNFGHKARPSMESCGIDVFQTARNNGLPIHTLKEKTETQNKYCLMLVD